MIRMLSIVAALLSTGTATGVAAQSAAPCTAWNVAGSWVLTQSNGPVLKVKLRQAAGVLSGTATYSYAGRGGGILSTPYGGYVDGVVEGTMSAASLRFVIKWDDGSIGQYVAGIQAGDATLRGSTAQVGKPGNQATFTGNRAAVCTSVRPAVADRKVSDVPPPIVVQTKPIRSLGKPASTTAKKVSAPPK